MEHPTRKMLSLALCMVIIIGTAESKRGCSSFGHSCFGGHGKRAELAYRAFQGVDNALGQSGGQRLGQDEIALPKPIYPQSTSDILGDDIIPIRNGGFTDNSDETNLEQIKLQLSPYIKRWLAAYRKAQENNGNGFPTNNLI